MAQPGRSQAAWTLLRARAAAVRKKPLVFTLVRALGRLGIDAKFLKARELIRAIGAGEPKRLEAIFLRTREALPGAGTADDDLRGTRILEIGCGPYGGLAPFMIARGAAGYIGLDPQADADVLRRRSVVRALARHYFAAAGLAGEGAGGADLAARYLERCRFARALAEAGLDAGSIDLITSVSCLEHVADPEGLLRALAPALAPGGRHLHLVNFSDHLDKSRPFGRLYALHPDAFRERFGPIVNMMRPSDMAALFERLGYETRLVPLDRRPDAVAAGALHPWWTGRYGTEELAIRTAAIEAVRRG